MPLQSHQTQSITFIGCKLVFAIASPCSPACFHVHLYWTLLCKTHFSSPITNRSKNGSFFSHSSKEMATEIRLILFLSVSKWGTPISSFKSNPMCFKRRKAVNRLTLSDVATFSVEIRGVFWTKVRRTSSSMWEDRPERGSSSRLNSPRRNSANHFSTVRWAGAWSW